MSSSNPTYMDDSESGEISEDELEDLPQIKATTKPLPAELSDSKLAESIQVTDSIQPQTHKRFSIWSELLVEDSPEVGKKKKKKNDRDVENYEFWNKNVSEMPDPTKSEQWVKEKLNLPEVKLRKKKNNKKKNRTKSDHKVAAEIAHKLKERKIDLIRKAIGLIGVKVAERICGEVLDIEETGGMMTNNGQRRRTPGGVFFQLIKHDNKISSAHKNALFEVSETTVIQRAAKKKLKKRERKKINKTLDALNNFSLGNSSGLSLDSAFPPPASSTADT